jgi:hypothetical protein
VKTSNLKCLFLIHGVSETGVRTRLQVGIVDRVGLCLSFSLFPEPKPNSIRPTLKGSILSLWDIIFYIKRPEKDNVQNCDILILTFLFNDNGLINEHCWWGGMKIGGWNCAQPTLSPPQISAGCSGQKPVTDWLTDYVIYGTATTKPLGIREYDPNFQDLNAASWSTHSICGQCHHFRGSGYFHAQDLTQCHILEAHSMSPTSLGTSTSPLSVSFSISNNVRLTTGENLEKTCVKINPAEVLYELSCYCILASCYTLLSISFKTQSLV